MGKNTQQINQKGNIAMQPQARDILTHLYCDWRNNYLTVDKFAEHNGLTSKQAVILIDLAREVFETDHPEA